ncbi:hypothetical protein [Mycobacteroides franklinii]|uniref:Transmembrane protein n=1 Tax=Mycobacteroides franklinii TaxID=948102 RepID=A0A4R8RBN5_9MYCO|nr:hypothetical protein [Mycobacteroides franklinii]TDZ43642.1 hypothetical protein CCUG64054_03700 [Mycobacteroides franklinii]TDZ50777.1 hypothetical protein CCUG63697_02286 [Mycobacteroides franklinii]TDZ57197.1 hypothetical protein CCUG63696_03702 [Mycobacteroides franklinii]TDZ64138.1 hypothetical protein CCUG63695_03627 [Mycobacteroides franklinii]TDZ70535.1 hypothetical protein CCUG64056_03700 [Mycobacteroides franklinii]
MTESDDTQRPVSVAELLARNGAADGKISGHRRRMRGNADAIPVAELTGEIPVIRDKKGGRARPNPAPTPETAVAPEAKAPEAPAPSGARSYLRSNEDALFGGDSMADEAARRGPSTPSAPGQPSAMASSLRSIFPPTPTPVARPGEPRKSIDFNDATGVISPVTGEPKSEPAPALKPEAATPAPAAEPAPPAVPIPPVTPPPSVSVPAPVEPEPELAPVPEPEAVVHPHAEPEPEAHPEVHPEVHEDGHDDYARHGEDDPYGRASAVEWTSHDAEHDVEGAENDYDENDYQLEHELQELVGQHGADSEVSQLAAADTDKRSESDTAAAKADRREKIKTYLQGSWIAAQYLLAAAAGAGLFFGFRELWSWNQGIALVLGVLFIAILVASLWVIRKTVDLASILIAIVVGALIAFGPLVLMLQAVD